MGKRKTTEEFVEQCIEIHSNKYDYSRVEYKNAASKVSIICKEHGEFTQIASNHARGRGCSKCRNEKMSLGLDYFIVRSKEVHGDRYDYSKVDYINSRTKVCIICKEHGEFWQYPDNHFRLKCGCLKCSGNIPYTIEEFADKASKIHNNEYNYSKVEYINNCTKVIIICKKHGDFLQTPQHHLDGSKCPKCSDNQQMTRDDFVKKAIVSHGDRYDYSKTKYSHIKNKEIITCKKHGEFEQKLDNHLQGKGCPHCINKNEGKVKELLLECFKGWSIIPNKKIWDSYKDYNHKRYCDFWLEKDGVEIIVEYDGKQHFEPVCFNGIPFKKAEKLFKKTQIKDGLDKQFCEENNIMLCRIRYDEDKEESIKKLRNSL